MGVQGKRKDRKIQKSRSEEKVVGFSSTSLFHTRKQEAVTQGGTTRIDHPMRRRNPVSSKAGRKSETANAFLIHSRKTRIPRARAL